MCAANLVTSQKNVHIKPYCSSHRRVPFCGLMGPNQISHAGHMVNQIIVEMQRTVLTSAQSTIIKVDNVSESFRNAQQFRDIF